MDIGKVERVMTVVTPEDLSEKRDVIKKEPVKKEAEKKLPAKIG